jgi:hypothetical protein
MPQIFSGLTLMTCFHGNSSVLLNSLPNQNLQNIDHPYLLTLLWVWDGALGSIVWDKTLEAFGAYGGPKYT